MAKFHNICTPDLTNVLPRIQCLPRQLCSTSLPINPLLDYYDMALTNHMPFWYCYSKYTNQKGMEYLWSNYSSSQGSFRAYCQPLFLLIWGSLQLWMCKSCKWMQTAVSSLPSELWIPESVCLGSGLVMSYRGINPLLFGTRKGPLHWRVCHYNSTPRQHLCILGRVEIPVACGSGASSRASPPAEQI